MPTHVLGYTLLLAVSIYSSCSQHAITLRYRQVEEYTFSHRELRTIQAIADDTTREVRRFLPGLPRDLVLEVFPTDDVVPEVGYRGEEHTRFVYWGVDPHHGGGVTTTAEQHLRPFLFEAFYRLIRFQTVGWGTMPDFVVGAGLVTVFARDFADTTYPWTAYPPEVADWVAELMALPADPPFRDWMNEHPDGRRWIGIKAGTYLVDRAVHTSGKSVADLISTPAEEIIELALGRDRSAGNGDRPPTRSVPP